MKITVQENTTKNPLTLAGMEGGICWNSDISDEMKNFQRGISCLESGHGRVLEFPQIYLTIEGLSARTARELYTHIAGAPTRLQASTRYIDYAKKGFEYITPPSIKKDEYAYQLWINTMEKLNDSLIALEETYHIPKEDVAMGLPLGMETKIVFRTNLRQFLDMCNQRMCTRAYWEFRLLIEEILKALAEYSEEWRYIINNYCKPKCEISGFCTEKKSCGRKPQVEK